ncbi:MAG: DUF2909 domain-containing protein [Pseudomonadales bacterium]|nr:DUF2909 domain-containing protein [Pseudomonadales bacterium]
MWFKIIIFIILILIVFSLFSALLSLVRNQSASGKTVKMLSYRVGFSILLLLFLGLSKQMGWVQPHDLKGQPSAHPVISAPSQNPTE